MFGGKALGWVGRGIDLDGARAPGVASESIGDRPCDPPAVVGGGRGPGCPKEGAVDRGSGAGQRRPGRQQQFCPLVPSGGEGCRGGDDGVPDDSAYRPARGVWGVWEEVRDGGRRYGGGMGGVLGGGEWSPCRLRVCSGGVPRLSFVYVLLQVIGARSVGGLQRAMAGTPPEGDRAACPRHPTTMTGTRGPVQPPYRPTIRPIRRIVRLHVAVCCLRTPWKMGV